MIAPAVSPPQVRLRRLLMLSIAAAITTIALKTSAWLLTGSVGLLSDAAESVVNLVAALVALWAVTYAAQPPDEDHAYGHEKADYLSAGIEGTMIVLAAVVILVTATARLLDPSPIDDAAIGIAVALGASLINLLVGKLLLDEGRKHRSLTVEADGRHLLTDVVTSVGVAIGVALVVISGVHVLDPIIALLVGVNIILTGARLIRRSLDGVLDRALSAEEIARAQAVLDGFSSDEVSFHAMRTRRAGSRAFVSIHVLVPGSWSVAQGHVLLEDVEAQMRAALDPAYVFTHLEPREDPASFEDIALDRGAADA